MTVFPLILACKKDDQVLCQMDCVVRQLLKTARSKDQVEILLVSGVRFLAGQTAKT